MAPTGKVVVVLTGHGMKDPGTAVEQAAEPARIPADVAALETYLDNS